MLKLFFRFPKFEWKKNYPNIRIPTQISAISNLHNFYGKETKAKYLFTFEFSEWTYSKGIKSLLKLFFRFPKFEWKKNYPNIRKKKKHKYPHSFESRKKKSWRLNDKTNKALKGFQMGFSCVMLLVNLYCLVVMAFEKDMRRLEFYLVILQTWSDFFFAGFVAFLFNVYQYIIISNGYCNYQNLVNLLHFYSDSGERWKEQYDLFDFLEGLFVHMPRCLLQTNSVI